MKEAQVVIEQWRKHYNTIRLAGMNVGDYLLMGAYHRSDGTAAIRRDLDFVFGLFPRLYERRRQDASTLSGGVQQMCAIARGLMAAPQLLMIDELSLGLAPRIVEELSAVHIKINQSGLSILVVEQDVQNGRGVKRTSR